MVPKFCRGCGGKLGVMERVYCARAGCQEKAREACAPGAMPKHVLLEMLATDAPKLTDASRRAALANLIEAVKAHPWDDCSTFLAKRAAIKSQPWIESFGKALSGDVSGDIAKPEPKLHVPRKCDSSIELHGILIPYAEAYLAAMPTEIFRGTHLEISRDVEDCVTVLGVHVGVLRQHVGPTPGKSMRGRLLELDTASAGIAIALHVKNESGQRIHFRATLFGTTLR